MDEEEEKEEEEEEGEKKKKKKKRTKKKKMKMKMKMKCRQKQSLGMKRYERRLCQILLQRKIIILTTTNAAFCSKIASDRTSAAVMA